MWVAEYVQTWAGRHEGGQLQEVVMKRTFATADLRAFVHIPGCTEDEGD